MCSQKKIEELKGELGIEAETLNKMYEEKKDELAEISAASGDCADQAAVVQERIDIVSSMTRMENRLKKITTAIKNESLGECDECGDAIPIARMRIDPANNNCVSCAEDLSIRRAAFR